MVTSINKQIRKIIQEEIKKKMLNESKLESQYIGIEREIFKTILDTIIKLWEKHSLINKKNETKNTIFDPKIFNKKSYSDITPEDRNDIKGELNVKQDTMKVEGKYFIPSQYFEYVVEKFIGKNPKSGEYNYNSLNDLKEIYNLKDITNLIYSLSDNKWAKKSQENYNNYIEKKFQLSDPKLLFKELLKLWDESTLKKYTDTKKVDGYIYFKLRGLLEMLEEKITKGESNSIKLNTIDLENPKGESGKRKSNWVILMTSYMNRLAHNYRDSLDPKKTVEPNQDLLGLRKEFPWFIGLVLLPRDPNHATQFDGWYRLDEK